MPAGAWSALRSLRGGKELGKPALIGMAVLHGETAVSVGAVQQPLC